MVRRRQKAKRAWRKKWLCSRCVDRRCWPHPGDIITAAFICVWALSVSFGVTKGASRSNSMIDRDIHVCYFCFFLCVQHSALAAWFTRAWSLDNISNWNVTPNAIMWCWHWHRPPEWHSFSFKCISYFSIMRWGWQVDIWFFIFALTLLILVVSQQMKVYRHKIIARFGLMHMIGTNLSVWLNVLIQETKHEILTFYDPENRTLRISHRLGKSMSRRLCTWAITVLI